MEKFHERLDYLMSDVLKISGNAIGRTLEVNLAIVSRYRSGETVPSIDFVEKLCKHYGVSANFMLLNIKPVFSSEIPINGEDSILNLVHEKTAMRADLDEFKIAFNDFREKYSI